MKNKKMNLGKLNLNKLTISSLQFLNGGRSIISPDNFDSGDGCDSKDKLCNSRNTAFTEIGSCCG